MAPSALQEVGQNNQHESPSQADSLRFVNGYRKMNQPTDSKRTEFLLDRNLHKSFPVVRGGKGNYLHLADGRCVFDTTAGAAVSALGHGDERVINAMFEQMQTGTPYLATTFFASEVVEELCKVLIEGTENKMSRIYLTGSG
jgi:adenosylmethionine-8-amino-7-oxononanoate aminotransferase